MHNITMEMLADVCMMHGMISHGNLLYYVRVDFVEHTMQELLRLYIIIVVLWSK